jgi:hypothetical protein
MRLPNSDNASISKVKLTQYILSETHEVGRFKAKFFRKLGFNEDNIDVFTEAIRAVAQLENIEDMQSSSYGTKYIIDGEIETPVGKTIKVTTVWVIEKGQKRPRFITIYPV